MHILFIKLKPRFGGKVKMGEEREINGGHRRIHLLSDRLNLWLLDDIATFYGCIIN